LVYQLHSLKKPDKTLLYPLTDLHVHGEAGFFIDESLARELANRNNIEFPEELLGQFR
jgi:hypothetical protein